MLIFLIKNLNKYASMAFLFDKTFNLCGKKLNNMFFEGNKGVMMGQYVWKSYSFCLGFQYWLIPRNVNFVNLKFPVIVFGTKKR